MVLLEEYLLLGDKSQLFEDIIMLISDGLQLLYFIPKVRYLLLVQFELILILQQNSFDFVHLRRQINFFVVDFGNSLLRLI